MIFFKTVLQDSVSWPKSVFCTSFPDLSGRLCRKSGRETVQKYTHSEKGFNHAGPRPEPTHCCSNPKGAQQLRMVAVVSIISPPDRRLLYLDPVVIDGSRSDKSC